MTHPSGAPACRLELEAAFCFSHWRKPIVQEAFMAKMAIFLFGFLALTIAIGLLATISPV
ncbi:hypothetical protein [Pseudomonas chlororaphis]|uniref:hypothetical protein n=1 Tax=Pseudomonas chlororaphis TaxID=587753 RepID=UPI000F57E00A|nr:hypothetical protein [Pseudomonas chlororaphis]